MMLPCEKSQHCGRDCAETTNTTQTLGECRRREDTTDYRRRRRLEHPALGSKRIGQTRKDTPVILPIGQLRAGAGLNAARSRGASIGPSRKSELVHTNGAILIPHRFHRFDYAPEIPAAGFHAIVERRASLSESLAVTAYVSGQRLDQCLPLLEGSTVTVGRRRGGLPQSK